MLSEYSNKLGYALLLSAKKVCVILIFKHWAGVLLTKLNTPPFTYKSNGDRYQSHKICSKTTFRQSTKLNNMKISHIKLWHTDHPQRSTEYKLIHSICSGIILSVPSSNIISSRDWENGLKFSLDFNVIHEIMLHFTSNKHIQKLFTQMFSINQSLSL